MYAKPSWILKNIKYLENRIKCIFIIRLSIFSPIKFKLRQFIIFKFYFTIKSDIFFNIYKIKYNWWIKCPSILDASIMAGHYGRTRPWWPAMAKIKNVKKIHWSEMTTFHFGHRPFWPDIMDGHHGHASMMSGHWPKLNKIQNAKSHFGWVQNVRPLQKLNKIQNR